MKVIIKTLEKMPKHTRGKPGAGMYFIEENLNENGPCLSEESPLELCFLSSEILPCSLVPPADFKTVVP